MPVGRLIDGNMDTHVTTEGSGVGPVNSKASVNAFDEIALEKVIGLDKRSVVSEATASSTSERHVAAMLRVAPAMGADRAVLVGGNRAFDTDNVAPIHPIADYSLVVPERVEIP